LRLPRGKRVPRNPAPPQRQRKRERSPNKYRDLYDWSPVALFTLTVKGRIREANRAGAALLGYPRDQLLDQPLSRFVAELSRPTLQAYLSQVLGGEGTESGELLLNGAPPPGRYVQMQGVGMERDGARLVQVALMDISKRKALEERLRKDDELLRAITDHSSEGINLLDLETGRYTFLNPAQVAMTGFTAEELNNISAAEAFERVHPEDRVISVTHQSQVAAGQVPQTAEYRWRVKNGEYRWFSDARSYIHDEQGRTVALVGISRDITKRKQAEAALKELNASLEQRVKERTAALEAEIQERRQIEADLRQSQETIREQLAEIEAVYATAPAGLALLDTGLRFVRISQTLADANGASIAAHLGRTLREMIPAIADQVESVLRQVIRTGEPVFNHESIAVTAARPMMPLSWRAQFVPFRDASGRISGVQVAAEDISEQRQVEERLRRNEERLRLAIEGAGAGTWYWDLTTGKLACSDRCLHHLGLPMHPLPSPEQVYAAMPPDDRHLVKRLVAGAIRDRQDFRAEYRVFWPDGSRHWINVLGRVSYSRQGRPLSMRGITLDITPRKQAEQDLRALNQDLELRVAARTAEARAASEAKSAFLAQMSHEIRTPLNGVLGLAQLLAREPLTERQWTMVARIQSAGESLLFLLNDILDLSKIEAGQIAIAPQPCELERLLAKLRDLFAPQAAQQGIALHLESQADHLGAVEVDCQRLEQVLVNLLGNALKFTPQGSVQLRMLIQALSQEEARLRFEVRDTGIGIAPATLETLFTPFTQGGNHISRRYGGTGLGLAISKRLVELMGGQIGAASQPGQGSLFWVELGLMRSHAGQPATTDATSLASLAMAPSLAGLRVLVVDDSEINREVVRQALELEGVEVSLASDGRPALEWLRLHPGACDAVLMDVQLPDLDGLAATRLIRSELGLGSLPIIALTAGVLPRQRQQALDAGMNAVLSKPVKLAEMTRLLQQWTRIPAEPSPRGAGAPAASQDGPPALGAPLQAPPQASAQALEFPAIAGIDRVMATSIFCGNRTLFLKTLGRFQDGFARLGTEAAQLLRAGDRETAARQLHNLRGNAGSLGANDLMEQARSLEEAIDRGETGLDEALARLQQDLDALYAAAHPWTSPSVEGDAD